MGHDRSGELLRAGIRVAGAAFAALLVGACGETTQTVVTENFEFEGTCIRCHDGLRSASVHANAQLRCIDCHGGNDQVNEVPADAFARESDFRSADWIAKSHVKLKQAALARFFWANGVDDDGDGQIDEGPTFQDLNNNGQIDVGETVTDFGEVAEPGLQGEGVGEFVDTEINRDLNYLRWLNPGDLRVATVSCGAMSRPALDGDGGSAGCHQPVIETVRRSVMVNQPAVIAGAYYGNQSWRETFTRARDDQGAASDPRHGAFAYTLDYNAVDRCIKPPMVDGALSKDARAQASFDSACLEASAISGDPNSDPNALADATGNRGLPAFELHQGALRPAAGTLADKTFQNLGVRKPRFPWGGTAIVDPTAALPELQPVPNQTLTAGAAGTIADPVDNVLRGFRAYYTLSYPGSTTNQNFTFGESILPNFAKLRFNNPFGRGHSSGCTGCHMAYNYSGQRDPQKVPVRKDGAIVFETHVDPTTKQHEFDPDTQDLATIGGSQRVAGMAVTVFDRKFTGRTQQQHFYSANHILTTQITTEQCGFCHTFVTRKDLAYQGMTEDEQRDAVARNTPINFTTPAGTKVRILDSSIREEKTAATGGLDVNGDGVGDGFELKIPDGVDIIKRAKQRDQQLATAGFIPGGGGCAPAVFTEDCNNNGELDRAVTLTRTDANGKTVETRTIDEDLNGNGILDLVDRLPREKSLDGRQMRYVYGGANGSTRLMDIHFQRGMHCIDCHFLQDTHGDGHVYSSNWDQIEIECEDCHGTLGQRGTLITSGANGGNDLTKARGLDGRPFFERSGDGSVIQRSRVTPGLTWKVTQVDDVVTPGSPNYNARAAAAMGVPSHMTAPLGPKERTKGSTFAGAQGASKLTAGKLECYSCHNSWSLNCLGCHYQANFGDKVKKAVRVGGAVEAVAGENEVWFNNANQPARTNFQLLEFARSPFVLGTNAKADGGRLAPFRSSMELHVSVADATNGSTAFDGITFTTFQKVDGNSGRANVATSGAAMNQTMPHTVRTSETKDCDWCHALVDTAGRVRNDHLMSQTFGIGAGRYPYVGDWALAAGADGIELFEYKAEHELAGSAGTNRFPGIIVSGADRVAANVEPILDGTNGIAAATFDSTDVALLRNFNPEPASAGATAPPTLTDLAINTITTAAGDGKLVISDITFRGHPSLAGRPSIGNPAKVFVLDTPGSAQGLATLSPDVSDPYVYVADGNSGLTVVKLRDRPGAVAQPAVIATTVAIPGGTRTANDVALAGDIAYVATQQGSVAVFDLAMPNAPLFLREITVGPAIRSLEVSGFFLYLATANGLGVLDIGDPRTPTVATGAANAIVLTGFNASGIYPSAGHVYVAAGTGGVLDIDATTPASARNLGNLAPAGVDARDVIVSKVPGQTWLLVADNSGTGRLVGIKLDNRRNTRERCLPNPAAAGCGLDMDWRDPMIIGRDPSFNATTQTFDATDPSSVLTFTLASTAGAGGKLLRLARPALWEQIGTQTGRRLRDSLMVGAGVLSLDVMSRMRGVRVCEAPSTPDVDGNGLGELGPADAAFRAGGPCVPFSQRP